MAEVNTAVPRSERVLPVGCEIKKVSYSYSLKGFATGTGDVRTQLRLAVERAMLSCEQLTNRS